MKNKEIYQKIIEEYPYCELCGRTDMLNIHHVFYRSQLGLTTEKNLIRLCIYCHNKVHSNKKKYQPMLLEIQYKKYGYFDKKEVVK